MKRGKLFAVSRFFVRLGLGRWSVDVKAPDGPTVYVCTHSNMRGPFDLRPWVLHVFVEREACRAQYRDYTFSQRFGMPKPLAAAAAWAPFPTVFPAPAPGLRFRTRINRCFWRFLR